MIKIKYIEDSGQTFMDCLVEIYHMKMVNCSFIIKRNDFIFMNHSEDQLDKVPSRIRPVYYRRLHVFTNSMN
jgi:hypothetical protein